MNKKIVIASVLSVVLGDAEAFARRPWIRSMATKGVYFANSVNNTRIAPTVPAPVVPATQHRIALQNIEREVNTIQADLAALAQRVTNAAQQLEVVLQWIRQEETSQITTVRHNDAANANNEN